MPCEKKQQELALPQRDSEAIDFRAALELFSDLVAQPPRGEHEGGRQAFSCQLRISGQNVSLGCTARGKLQQEIDAEARSPDARLAAKHFGLGHDPLIAQGLTSLAKDMMP